jgi:hypothetical protein
MTTTETLSPQIFIDYTHAIIEKSVGSETLQGTIATGVSEEDAIRLITQIQVNGPLSSERTKGQEAQSLTDWHRIASGLCSELYADLKAQHPDLSRAAINEDAELRRLNAVRRGIRAAMNISHTQAARRSR